MVNKLHHFKLKHQHLFSQSKFLISIVLVKLIQHLISGTNKILILWP